MLLVERGHESAAVLLSISEIVGVWPQKRQATPARMGQTARTPS
jgi:hypothetical protein